MITTGLAVSERAPSSEPASPPLFARAAGPLAVAAGALLLVGQAIWWPFDQVKNLATAQNDVFHAGSVVYLAGFWVLVFALIGVHGRQAARAGRFGMFGFSAALVGTMLLGGDLWFETFAVPWLAEGPLPEVLSSPPSTLFGLGALSSYCLFAFGWVSFGLASLRARVIPVWISVLLVVGGVAGYNALLSPWGMPLALAVTALGVWLVKGRPASADDGVGPRPASVSE